MGYAHLEGYALIVGLRPSKGFALVRAKAHWATPNRMGYAHMWAFGLRMGFAHWMGYAHLTPFASLRFALFG